MFGSFTPGFHSWVFECLAVSLLGVRISAVSLLGVRISAVSLLGVRVFGSFTPGCSNFDSFTPGCSSVRQFHSWVSVEAVSLLGVRSFTPGFQDVRQFPSWVFVFECSHASHSWVFEFRQFHIVSVVRISAVSLLGVRVFGSFTPGFHSWVFECLAVSLLGVQVFGSLSEETRQDGM